MGTATYFSPEQAQGGHARPPQRPLLARHRDVRDGRRPAAVHRRQPGRHRLQAGARGAAAAAPAHARRARRPYEAIVAKLLAKNPAARYPSADDLRAGPAPLPRRPAPRGPRAGRSRAPASAAPRPWRPPPRPSTLRCRRPTASPPPSSPHRPAPRCSRRSPRGYAAATPADYDEPPPHRAGCGRASSSPCCVLAVGGFLLYKALNRNDPSAPTTIVDARADEQAARRGHEGPHRPRLRGQDHADAAGQRRRRREHRLRAGPGRRAPRCRRTATSR